VVSDYTAIENTSFQLVEPYIVNGCQTTRTIWEVCFSRFDSGGTGRSAKLEDWRRRASRGCVVTKVAKVGNDGEELLQAITRYTNSQNAVRDKDFIALSADFRGWHAQLADKYDLYLAFSKWERLGKSQEATPRLLEGLAIQKRFMGQVRGQPRSPRQVIADAFKVQTAQ